MARRHPEMVHHYDRQSNRILCGVDDPHAHWTTRRSVSCADCAALLREREREHDREVASHVGAHGAATL